jgi:hypothetical protein
LRATSSIILCSTPREVRCRQSTCISLESTLLRCQCRSPRRTIVMNPFSSLPVPSVPPLLQNPNSSANLSTSTPYSHQLNPPEGIKIEGGTREDLPVHSTFQIPLRLIPTLRIIIPRTFHASEVLAHRRRTFALVVKWKGSSVGWTRGRRSSHVRHPNES